MFISNFLSDRIFQVRFHRTMSDIFIQEEGVPQGAILSTTLFNIKINDIVKTLGLEIECSLYVDDFLICCRAPNTFAIETNLQRQIYRLEKWTLENGFTISLDKTVVMHFIPPKLGYKQRKENPDPYLVLGEHKIKVVEKTKFLGLIWDSKLNFKAHIEYLKKKCMKAMNILRVLAHSDWGADQSTLLHLYRALIRSKLDYGCIVYGSARKSYLEKLDPIQNNALRLCLGAFRSSPIDSLYVEANEPPLEYRRIKLTLQYGLKLKANPDIPSYEYVYPTNYTYKRCQRKSTNPPLRVRLQSLLDESGIGFDDVAVSEDLLDLPVWDITPVKCLTHLADYNKDDTLPYIFKHEFKFIEDQFLDFDHIYTDGSKSDEKVACAFVTKNGPISYRLPDNTSIFTAEAKAVERALQYIKTNPISKKFIVFTDSLSLIQSLQNTNLKNPLIGKILRNCNIVEKQGKDLYFCWVPSHCGIPGNEKADQAAKSAINNPIYHIDIPYTDKIPLIRNFLQTKWQTEWDKADDNKLHEIKPFLGPPLLINSSRKDQVILNRIRIGHTRLTHSYLMDKETLQNKPKCHFCTTNSNLTVEHFLIKCIHFTAIRFNYFNVSTMKQLFDDINSDKILGFLKETSLYNQI